MYPRQTSTSMVFVFGTIVSLSMLFISCATAAVPTKMMEMTTVMSSPEPSDALDQGLYLYRMGFPPLLISPLRNGMKVCISSYKEGITIRCVGQSRVARFFVNGTRVRTEYREPFYISGDRMGLVRPWKAPSGKVLIRCKLSNPIRNFRAVVNFEC